MFVPHLHKWQKYDNKYPETICRTRRKEGWGCCGSMVTTKTRTRPMRILGSTVTMKKMMNLRWGQTSNPVLCNQRLNLIHRIIHEFTFHLFFQFETISQPSPAPSISRREGELLPSARTHQEVGSASSSRSSTLSRPNPPGTLSVSRTSSGRSRVEENQEWDAKLLGKPGMEEDWHMKYSHLTNTLYCTSGYLVRQGKCVRG